MPNGPSEIDFHDREGRRARAFSSIWNERLNAVFADVAPYYDIASNFASFGLYRLWLRRFAAGIALRPGSRVLDLCAGTNGVGIELLRREPAIKVVGMDRSPAMQAEGRRRARAAGVAIGSVIGDAHSLPFPDGAFDAVTLQFASRHLRIMDVAREVIRVLKPGGRFYHSDILRPESPLVEAVYGLYLNVCVGVTALAFGSGPAARGCRDYFVRAVELFYSPEEFTRMLRQVGFAEVTCRSAFNGGLATHRAVGP